MKVDSLSLKGLPVVDLNWGNSNSYMIPGHAESCLEMLPSESIDLVITSPPYNIGKEYETKQHIEPYLANLKPVIEKLCDLLSPTGSICWQVGSYVDDGEVFPLDIYYYPIFKKLGLRLSNRIVWRFGHGLHAQQRFSGRYETILWFTKGKNFTFNLDAVRIPAKYPNKRYSKGEKKGQLSGNPLGKNPTDVWEIVASDWDLGVWEIPNVKAKHREATIHPCQFPVELAERCVLALSRVGDTVLDPFMGVGSSIVAAIKHGRRAIGIDKEERYVDIARDRVAKLMIDELPLRPLGQPVFCPSKAGKVARIPQEWQDNQDSIYSMPSKTDPSVTEEERPKLHHRDENAF